jgi:hypothetical protein
VPAGTGGCSSSPWWRASPNVTRKAQNPVPLPSGRQPGPLPRELTRGKTSMRPVVRDSQAGLPLDGARLEIGGYLSKP